MLKSLMAAALVVAAMGAAQAQTVIRTHHDRATRTTTTIIGTPYVQPMARVIDVRDSHEPASKEVRDRWLARCQPRIEAGPHGVQRWTYTERGCEYGP